jgi:putative ABC transport system substrate-binding protein
MRRREVIAVAAGALAARAAPAGAQERVRRIGLLSVGDLETTHRYTIPELALLGFAVGRNLEVVERAAAGDTARLPAMARELVAARVELIVAVANVAIEAARDAAPGLPIVMGFAGQDPVAAGLAQSLARPGGMVTGISFLGGEADLKRLEVLRNALPGSRRFAYLAPPTEPWREREMEAVAAALGVELAIGRPARADEIAGAIDALAAARPDGLVVSTYPVLTGAAGAVVARATASGMATICGLREMAREGCLIAYGPNVRALRRRVAHYVARILRGAAPGELPIEQPDVFDLTVNLRTAKALGIELPPAILSLAEEVIE